MDTPRKLLACAALSVGTLLSFSAGADPAPKSAHTADAGVRRAHDPAAAPGTAKEKPRAYRCRVGNGKGAHYVDSAYPCAAKGAPTRPPVSR